MRAVRAPGCVCCTVRGDLIRALNELHKKGPFDAVPLKRLRHGPLVPRPAPISPATVAPLHAACRLRSAPKSP